MFDDFFILSTAISSFNNAALYNPLFLSIGVLMAPLFFWVYLYAPDFISRIGWDKKDMVAKTGFFSSLILMLWLLIFGGNYAVIRDGISLLPLVIAFVLFMITLFVVNQSIFLKYIEKISGARRVIRYAHLVWDTVANQCDYLWYDCWMSHKETNKPCPNDFVFNGCCYGRNFNAA